MSAIQPFTIAIPNADLQDLLTRAARGRIASDETGASWSQGPDTTWIESMRDRLVGGFDWRAQEAAINAHPQFTTEIDGQRIHFLHVVSDRRDATPLLLLHGWPGSFVEFLDVIEPLTRPTDGGAAFHVIIPSLPGFGFSGPTRDAGWTNVRIAAAMLELMTRLGYTRFGVQGGDAGAIIAPEMARIAPDRVIGVQLNAATVGFIPMGPIDPSEFATFSALEHTRLERMQRFMSEYFSFNALQSQRPRALAFALNDSPIGMLAWMSELFTSFGERPDAVRADAILTNLLVYWFTGTIGSSMRLYYENAHDPSAWAPKENSGVPTGVAVYGHDEVAIRRFGEDSNTITRWTELDRGGHFAALEVPELWTAEVRAFFAAVVTASRES